MRGRIVVAAVFLLTQAQIGLAQGGAPGVDVARGAPRRALACTVTVLDTVSMNFVCQTNRAARRFWVARSTHFIAGGPNGTFFHLKTGQPVEVTFHGTGPHPVADIVRFQS